MIAGKIDIILHPIMSTVYDKIEIWWVFNGNLNRSFGHGPLWVKKGKENT